MKVLAIGDIHQTENWKRFDFTKYDKVIFLGDYFDDHGSNWSKLNPISNLLEILSLQSQDHEKYVVLAGNHDFQYLADEEYSGKQVNMQWDIKEFLEQHLKEFRLCYQIEDYLFSHAGVSSMWAKEMKINDVKTINSFLWNKCYPLLGFYPWDFSMCGRHPMQSLIWIRPEALCEYPWKNYNQVVGHTSNIGNNGVAIFNMKNDKKLYVVDNQEHTAYLELEI